MAHELAPSNRYAWLLQIGAVQRRSDRNFALRARVAIFKANGFLAGQCRSSLERESIFAEDMLPGPAFVCLREYVEALTLRVKSLARRRARSGTA